MIYDYKDLDTAQKDFLRSKYTDRKAALQSDFRAYSYNYVPKKELDNPLSYFIDKMLGKKYAKDVVEYYFDLEMAKYIDQKAPEEHEGIIHKYLPNRTNPRDYATLNYMVFYMVLFAAVFTGIGALSSHLLSEVLIGAGTMSEPAVLFGIVGSEGVHQGVIPGLITGSIAGAFTGYKFGMSSRTSLKEPAEYGRSRAQQFVIDSMQEYQDVTQDKRLSVLEIEDERQRKEDERQREVDEKHQESFNKMDQKIDALKKSTENTLEEITSRVSRLEQPYNPRGSYQDSVLASRAAPPTFPYRY